MEKIAVVTGGASGIGQAVVERLVRDDFTVVILDINEEGGKQVAAEIQGHGKPAAFIALDVTREADLQKTFQKIISDHGRIDVLVNVAGGSLHRHPIGEFPLDHWRAVIDANLTSTFLCCRAVIDLMKKQKSGAIVNISSDIGFSGDAGRSAYAAAKAGIVGFSKTLALELAPFGARQCGRSGTNRDQARPGDILGRRVGNRGQKNPPRPRRRTFGRCRSRSISRRRFEPSHDGTNASHQRRENYGLAAPAIVTSRSPG